MALTLAFMGLSAACTERSEPPIRVGTNTWPGYEPLYLAQDIGRFGPDAVRLTRHDSTTAVLAAYRAGRLDATPGVGVTAGSITALHVVENPGGPSARNPGTGATGHIDRKTDQ